MTEIEGARPEGDLSKYGILVVDDEPSVVELQEELPRAVGAQLRSLAALPPRAFSDGEATKDTIEKY